MASHVAVCPRTSPKREIKFTSESFCNEKNSAEGLQRDDAGIKDISSNSSKYYDQLPDPTPMLGAVADRGTASVPAIEIIKWPDTSNCFIVLELVPDVKFSCAPSDKAIYEHKEAKALGVNSVSVLVDPVFYMLLSKPTMGVDKTFSLLSLHGKILPIYKEVVSELKAARDSWIQFDELTLVMDLDSHKLQAFTEAYAQLESSPFGLNVLIETYFADIPAKAYIILTYMKGVAGFGFDLVCGTQTLDLIKGAFPKGKYLFPGVVDGRNMWENNLAASLSTLNALEGIVGNYKLVISISCFLLHTAVGLVNETKLEKEIKSWLDFAAQKVVEVSVLAKQSAGQKDEIHSHICYSHFNDFIHSISDMDANVITTENSHSDEKLLSVFPEEVKYGAGIEPCVYDIHSLRIPSTEEIADRINKILAVLEKNVLWVNPDCGSKTRNYTEVKPARKNVVAVA